MPISTLLASLPLLSLLAADPFQPWSVDLLKGDWGQLYDDESPSSYQFFRFDPEKCAIWTQSHEGDGPMHFEFPADGIAEDNGLVILTARPREDFQVRFVVSAYRISEYKDTGLATGILYMFQRQAGEWMLFNSIPFRGRALEAGDPIYSHEKLRQILDE